MVSDPTLLDRLTRQLEELDRQAEVQVPEAPAPVAAPPGATPAIPVGEPGGVRPPQALTAPESIFDRVTGAAGVRAEKTVGPPTGPGEGEPISTIGELGTAALKVVGEGFGAVFGGFEQLLEEAGVSKTNSRRLTRDAFGVLESTIPLGLGSPVPVATVGRAARRKALRTQRVEKGAGMLADRIARREEAAAKNLVARQAREAARAAAIKGGKSEADANVVGARAAAEIDLSVERAVRENADNLLRAPDEILDMIPAAETTVVPLELQEQAVGVARRVLTERGIDPGSLSPQRVQVLVMDLLNTGRNIEGFRLAIEAAGFENIEAFGRAFVATGTEASRTLNLRRAFFAQSRRDALFSEKGEIAEGARAFLERVEASVEGQLKINPFEQLELLSDQAPRIWRKLLISLPTTAVRNAIDSGIFRITLDSLQRMTEVTLQRVFAPGSLRLPADPFGDLARLFGGEARGGVPPPALNKAMMERITNAFPEVKSRVFGSLEADIGRTRKLERGLPLTRLDKLEGGIDKVLLFLNRAQEFAIRTAILGGSLDRRLQRVNSSLNEMFATKTIPAGFEEALQGAMFDSLFMTFALRAEAGSNRQLSRFFAGYATVLEASRIGPYMEPFPNFIFNATRLIMESTTSGFLRLTRDINRAKFAVGDMNPLGREIVGAGLLATAVAMRTGNFPGLTPGPKYDEFELRDGTTVSLAPFATAIPSLFLADLIIRLNAGTVNPDTFSMKELRRGLLSSAPQVEQASSAVQDAIRGIADFVSDAGVTPGADFTQKLMELLGNTGAGALRPFQAVRAVVAEVSEEYEKLREIRGQGGFAPIQNIFAPQSLPERESPIKGETGRTPRLTIPLSKIPPLAGRRLPDVTIGGQLVSQFTGLTMREARTPFARKLVELGIPARDFSPKTGNTRLNALVSRFSGPLAERAGNVVVTAPTWRHLGVKGQKLVLLEILKVSREVGRQLADVASPAGGVERRLRRLPRRQFNAMLERINQQMGGKVTIQEIFNQVREQVNIELEGEGL